MLAKEAYALGVETVDVRYRNVAHEREMFLGAPEEFKLYEPKWVTVRAEEIVAHDGAAVILNGNGRLGIMDDVDPKYPSGFRSAYMKSNEPYSSRRRSMVQPWTIIDVPTEAWAKKLGMSIEELWEFLFTVSGAASGDGLAYAASVNDAIQKRCKILNSLKITRLLFLGKGNNLTVGLSPKAVWLGGRHQAEDGTWFEANWPSFEIFTTPDWRQTEGGIRVTLPSVLSGPVVDGLGVVFTKGRVSAYEATKGKEAFESLITQDEGASQLGEIALVGLDSPLSKYDYPHYCGLLDENKRCHMAFGNAYPAALEGGVTASAEELAELGCNKSEVHHDMMISDKDTYVFAYNAKGEMVAQLIKLGEWTEEFL